MNILTIGGATQDVLIQCDGADVMTIAQRQGSQSFLLFEAGEKIEIDNIQQLSGGGATNVAVSFKRQGFAVECVCAVGNDAASAHLLDDLATEGVGTAHIKRITSTPTGTSYIITSLYGDRTIFTYRGANTKLTLTDVDFAAIKQATYVYATSLSREAGLLLPALTTFAKQHNIPVAVNPGKSQLASSTATLKDAIKHIDILIVNSAEAKILMTTLTTHDEAYKTAFHTNNTHNPCDLNAPDSTPYLLNAPIACQGMRFSMENFFRVALSMGPRIVVVTNGANGVYVAHENTILFHPSLRVPVVNTVGAGDAFGSAFVGSLIMRKSIEDALHRGVINSASVLAHQGAKTGLLNATKLGEEELRIPKTIATFKL